MGDILQFPKYQSARIRAEKKMQERRAVLALSVGSIMLVGIFMNQVLVRNQTKSVSGLRGIASVESNVEAPGMEQMQKDALAQWEVAKAKELANDRGLGSQVQRAIQPGMHDQLVFGLLEGKYNVQLNRGKITELAFNKNQTGVDPVTLTDPEGLLRDFKSEFAPQFNEVKRQPASDGSAMEFQLLDHGKAKGSAQFEMGKDNKVLTIKLKSLE